MKMASQNNPQAQSQIQLANQQPREESDEQEAQA